MARIRLILAALLLFAPGVALAQLGAQTSLTVNAQTGTSYTVLNSDCGKLVSLNNASAVAVTLPEAGAASRFAPGCVIRLANLGAGNATITPQTSTIGGRTSVILQQGGGVEIASSAGNWTPLGIFPALSANNLVDPDNLPTAAAGGNIKGAIIPGTCLSMGGPSNKVMSVSTECAATGFAMPFNTIPTTADVDIYGTGFAVNIAASTVPTALCRVSPAATVTFLVKKWTAGNPATSSTLCTGSLSTSCAVSSCSISATSFTAADGISVEATAASADSAARVTITVPMTR